MAGGRWVTQNKIRPGAYINFRSVPRPLSSVGTRGVVTFPISMGWGPTDELIELYSTDLVDGTSIDKIGLSGYDEAALPFRAALSNAYKAYVYRLNSGGTTATVVQEEGVTVTARYPGALGNSITVAIIALNPDAEPEDSEFAVVTFYQGVEKDRQVIKILDELAENSWVEFSGTGAPTPTPTDAAGLPLAGGTDGTVTAATAIPEYIRLLQGVSWNVMGVQYTTQDIKNPLMDYIEDLRENQGIARQLVVNNDNSRNYEGIITTKGQGFSDAYDNYDAEMFTLYLAGLEAGAEITQSRTYFAIPGAQKIIGPLLGPEIEEAIQEGYVVLTTRQDGAVVIEQDINSLHNFTVDKNYLFSKNKIIRILDQINNDISLLFEVSYIGKVNNNEDGRMVFKADIIAYLNTLQNLGAIQNFNPSTDLTVVKGQAIDAVLVDLLIQPVDAMEKLYMTVMVGEED